MRNRDLSSLLPGLLGGLGVVTVVLAFGWPASTHQPAQAPGTRTHQQPSAATRAGDATARVVKTKPAPREETDRERWERRLARTDDHLVAQAVAAGCDDARAALMRETLAAFRAARLKILEATRSGSIERAEMHQQARAAQQVRDRSLARILSPDEIAALDVEGARLVTLCEER